jgi:predicted methyltransferase
VPPEAVPLDVVTMILNYHDISYLPVDRDALNRKIFAALKPGGRYVIVDHSALPGTGITAGKTLHRIEEAFVGGGSEARGIRARRRGLVHAQPADTRDRVVGAAAPTDKFVLRFVKPR